MKLRTAWEGECIRVETDGVTWSWYRCMYCHRPLTDDRARATGVGRDCAKAHTEEQISRRRFVVLKLDRKRYMNRLDVERIVERNRQLKDEGPD